MMNNYIVSDVKYSPHCHLGPGYVDVNEPCSVKCNNTKLSAAIGEQTLNMTCVDKNLNYKLCPNNSEEFSLLAKDQQNNSCEVSNHAYSK